MTLAFAGFPVDTYKAAGSTRMFVLSIIRSEADRLGRCHKDQRYLAAKAGIALGTFGYHFGKLKKRGIVVLLRHGRRRKGIIIIRPEHRWVTAEKPAPREVPRTPAGEGCIPLRHASECSKISNTSCKARSIKPPFPESTESLRREAQAKIVENQWVDTSPASKAEPVSETASPPSGDDPRPPFIPIRTERRPRKPEAEVARNRALKSAKIKRWLGATRQWEGQAIFHDAVAGTTLAGGLAPPTPEQLRIFDLAAQALDASGWNDIPEHWYERHGITSPVERVLQQRAEAIAQPPHQVAEAPPAKSRHDVYRESMRIVAAELAARAAR